jgi:hypothetical protein
MILDPALMERFADDVNSGVEARRIAGRYNEIASGLEAVSGNDNASHSASFPASRPAFTPS